MKIMKVDKLRRFLYVLLVFYMKNNFVLEDYKNLNFCLIIYFIQRFARFVLGLQLVFALLMCINLFLGC